MNVTLFLFLVLTPIGQQSKPDTLFQYVIDGQVVENLAESRLVNKTIQMLDIDTIRTPEHITIQYTITTSSAPIVSEKIYILDGKVVPKEVIDHLKPSLIKEIIVNLEGGDLSERITGNRKTGIVIVNTQKGIRSKRKRSSARPENSF